MKLHDMVSKFHHERQSFFFCPVQPCILWRILLIKQHLCPAALLLQTCDVIHLDWKDLVFCYKKNLFFLPSYLAVLSITLLSCCRNVICDKVTGEANSSWKAATIS